MSFYDATRFSDPLDTPSTPPPFDRAKNKAESESNIYHGEALARDPQSEQHGQSIMFIFTAAFALFLIGMVLAGQAPGKSFPLKGLSDVFQFVGEGIGFVFCLRITMRLRIASLRLRYQFLQKESAHASANELAIARNESQAAQRAYFAWLFLAIGIALYAGGQAIWTSYDVRMNSAEVPFPGLYDIGFVGSYPFFLLGTLLLTRRNKASVGRIRLLLDAFGVIGAAVALSWFFLLKPLIAGLAQAPSPGAAFLSIYFPAGDLFLVAIGAFLMFSPLANRAQQPVFLRLCLGLFFLAVTDSMLAYFSLSNNFNTGTLQDILWPLSMLLIGLAAIEYPRSIAREQAEAAQVNTTRQKFSTQLSMGRGTQLIPTLQTITPFILVLLTCAILLTVIAPEGGDVLIEAEIVALLLISIVVARQALTLIENNRLTMQMRGELVISRRELQVTKREANEAERNAQEKQVLEEGIATLRDIHARVARGDIAARAPTVAGPLLPIAISLNLMLDRLSSLSQRGARYDYLTQECRMVQAAVERLGQGLPAWSANEPAPQSNTELRSIHLGLMHLQRFYEGQWRRLTSAHESMGNLTRRIREALAEIRHAPLFQDTNRSNFERMILDRIIREIDLLEQQQRSVFVQASQSVARFEQSAVSNSHHSGEEQLPVQVRTSSLQRHRSQNLPSPLLDPGQWERRPAKVDALQPAEEAFLFAPPSSLYTPPANYTVAPSTRKTDDL
ncbi:MAG TPA: hypothetical protein VL485_03320 [Ktedonobacteraceae bacterium]|nr:hypothetical protein [Ktedonobacteraceae bacterium]